MPPRRRTLTPLFAILALLGFAPPDGVAGRLFTAPGYMLGPPYFTRSLSLVDLNGDGMDDLVVSLASGKGLATALSEGGGSFAPFTTTFAGRGDLVADTADLDGDGRIDFGGLGFNHFGPDSSVVLVGYGDGNGGWIDSFQVRTPGISETLTLGDLDGDGRADVIAGMKDSTVAVWRGNADRTVTYLGSYPAPGIVSSPVLADLVGSSAPDLIVSYSQDYPGVSVFEGNGDGTFGARVDRNLGGSGSLLALGALDSQPALDLVLAASGVRYASGLGGGDFAVPVSLPSGALGFGLVLADLDHDGKLDVASTHNGTGDRGIATWLGDGAGGFGARTISGRSVFVPGGLEGGDVDEDGNLDLVYPGSFAANLVLATGNGDGTYGQARSVPPVSGQINGLATGDFDGDGKLDAVGSNTFTFTLAFAKGHGDGSFDPLVVSSGMALSYFRLAAGRFDADANLDLVGISRTDPTLSFLRGRGDGTFDPPVDFPLGAAPGSAITVVDIDGNGKSDVVVPCPDANALKVLLQGPAGLAAPTTSPTPAGPFAVRYADLNADGRKDRVVTCTNQWAVQLDDGAGGYGTFETHAQTPTPGDIVLADFDGDGAPDAAVSQGTTTPFPAALVHVWRGHADGSFDSESIAKLDWFESSETDVSSSRPIVAQLFAEDFDGDGRVDLVAREGSNASVAIVARGNGDRTFGRPEAYSSGLGTSGLATGDFDGDGFVDLLASGSNGSTPITGIQVMLNRSSGVTGVPPVARPARIELAISSLAPNPSRGAFALELQAARAGTARVALYSPAGRVVFERAGIALAAGTNHVTLDAGRALAPGVYWVRVSDGTASAVRKAVLLP